jgi:hypothetical protein
MNTETKKESDTKGGTREFDRFQELAKKLVSVPKKDIKEAEKHARSKGGKTKNA